MTQAQRVTGFEVFGVVTGLILVGGLLCGGGYWWFVGSQHYHVWQQGMVGKAKLAEAEFSRQIATQEAHAKMESAKLLADAEVERAKGVAKANEIIGKSLEGNEAYLHYLWIHNLESGDHDVVYIPTEAGLPIFEAGGRFHNTVDKK